jgi:hypothetical protein
MIGKHHPLEIFNGALCNRVGKEETARSGILVR